MPGGGAEQDPDQWWRGVKQAARHAIRESNVAPTDIMAIGCDSQWSVVVPVDRHVEPLMRAVHWMDTRGGPHNCSITALLALITLGYRSIDEIANLVRFKRRFEPDESNRVTYDRMYTQYRELFKKNKRIFKELNG